MRLCFERILRGCLAVQSEAGVSLEWVDGIDARDDDYEEAEGV